MIYSGYTKKLILPLLLLSIFFAGCATTPNGTSQACTEEAKVCPDGSTVGRTEPNCEFAPCPEVSIQSGSTQPIACTMEAKVCSDGSAVGRSGPNCEFTPCPGEENNCTTTCSCPEGYVQEGESCTPNCYYSTPRCLAPSMQCQAKTICSK